MIKTLSQIVASFLALVIGFIVAYLIYLNSVQANIDEKIQDNGSEIASLIKNAPVYADTYNRLLWVFDYRPLTNYQELFPASSIIDIHKQIAQDLAMAWVFEKQDAMDRLSVFKDLNGKGPIYGRIWINLLKKSIDYLAPQEIWWPGRTPVPVQLGFPRPTAQDELFPFGPLGVEQWSNDFLAINNNIEFLLYYKEYFIPDLQQFIKYANKDRRRNKLELDSNDLVNQIDDVVSKIESKNNHIQNLLKLKKNYLLTNRLPHIFWISLLYALALMSGVLIPIVLLCLKKDENDLSLRLNLLIASTTIIFLISGTACLIKDVAFANNNEYIEAKYLSTLRTQLIKDNNSHEQRVSFDYRSVSHLLSDKSKTDLPKELINLLEQYRNAVVDSNRCSEQMIESLSDALQKSTILSAYKNKSGGYSEKIWALISLERRSAFYEKLLAPLNIISFETAYGGFSRYDLTIKLPNNIEQIREIQSEIDRVYNKHLDSENGNDCISKRNILKNNREKVMMHISKLTGSFNKQ